ncbi:TrmH family RNA methyltransferase [Mycoplasmopsis primatum]|uniref:TrmH family RNA methyltransferase n=1 Tax=Mycoplasmopsis primatum TaxID=55604 RepID=UPI0006896174|nr:RNA methyltransferase [Mycoplasmopsis primatum]
MESLKRYNNKTFNSVSNSHIRELRKILAGKIDDYFLIEGYHLVEEAYKNNLVVATYELIDKKAIYAESNFISYDILKYLTQTTNPEGIVALCSFRNQKTRKQNKVVFLDNVQDPGNVGTIIRTAKAFGFDTIYSNVHFNNQKVIRSSQGAIFSVNTKKYDNAYKTILELQNQGYKIYTTSLEKDSININSFDFPVNEKIVIVFGNEGSGVASNINKLANKKIYIPIEFESLNVAVSAGIVLYKIYNSKK